MEGYPGFNSTLLDLFTTNLRLLGELESVNLSKIDWLASRPLNESEGILGRVLAFFLYVGTMCSVAAFDYYYK